MKIDAATEAEILAVVMRWTSIVGDHAVYRRHDDSIRVYADSNDYEGRIVSPAIALAWALTVETDPEPVDVGRCPACVERGGTMEWHRVVGSSMADAHFRITASVGPPWEVAAHRWWNPDISHGVASRPCPACTGTGRETVPLARLLLDAANNQRARDQLHAHADYLCANGNPIGELLRCVLTFWMKPLAVDERDVTPDSVDMSLAHTAEALRWLEWLTWHRWFAQMRALSDVDYASLDRRVANMYHMHVDGFVYEFSTDYADRPIAQDLADAFNAQGGPATFTATDGSLTVTMNDLGTMSAADEQALIARLNEMEQSENPRRRQHAPHVGDRLARRLGVRV